MLSGRKNIFYRKNLALKQLEENWPISRDVKLYASEVIWMMTNEIDKAQYNLFIFTFNRHIE